MKNVLVTGISRGLGKATTELLVSQGYRVYGTYNTERDAAEKLKKSYENVNIYRVDLCNHQSIQLLLDELGDVPFDGIVNNAGVFLDIDFANFSVDDFEKTFAVNAFAPLYLAQGLKDNLTDGASIINISSTDASVGSIAGLAYSASKAALNNITQSLANILGGRGIRVNTIALGWMGDGMQAPEELLTLAARHNPLGRVASYSECAEVVAFLLSDKASYVNGTTVTVDGGDMATSYILQKEAEILSGHWVAVE